MVWSLTEASTGSPSTNAPVSVIPPSRGATVLSSTRSIETPEVLRIVAIDSTRTLRESQPMRIRAS